MGNHATTETPVRTLAPASPASRAADGDAGAAAADAPRARPFASRRFYVCTALLAGSAVFVQVIAHVFEQHFHKGPVPLRLALHRLDKSRFGPEYEFYPVQPGPLAEELVSQLGTEEYVYRIIVDTALPATDPRKLAHVFISYYTGKPDPVPHHPKECMIATGWQLGDSTIESVPVPGVGAPGEQVPVQIATFFKGGRGGGPRSEQAVAFFFHANGDWAPDREAVRWRLSNLRDRFAYYAKIELRFSDGQVRRYADWGETREALPPLLAKLLPTLLNDHLQDWETYSRRR